MTQLNTKRIKLITMYIMSIFYISVGINHFIEPEWFIQIVPPYLSKYDLELVYISGVFEVMFGTLIYGRSILQKIIQFIFLVIRKTTF